MTAQLDQIKDFLKELDSRLHLNKVEKLYLIGGGAITLAYDPENKTADIDLIDPPNSLVKLGGKDSNLARKFNVYVSSVSEINFSVPGDWKSKCTLLPLKLKHLKVFVPCIEDIVLGKLARMEPKDFEDILSLHERKLLDPKMLLVRLHENKKELRELPYRNNTLLLFQEVFGLKLTFQDGTIHLTKKIKKS